MKIVDRRSGRKAGFSLIELLVVVGIILIISAMAMPWFINIMRNYRLQVATTNCMGIVQQARMHAVQDARFYSLYYIGGGATARQYYLDIYPKLANGTSGNGGAGIACDAPPPNGSGLCDISVQLPGEVQPQRAGAAPQTNALQNLFLQGQANVNPYDGVDPTTPISFGPEGVPCLPMGLAQGVVGGSICNTRSNWKNPGAPVAYWLFFQNNITQAWEAVTVTPAGRIQRWNYSNAGWSRG